MGDIGAAWRQAGVTMEAELRKLGKQLGEANEKAKTECASRDNWKERCQAAVEVTAERNKAQAEAASFESIVDALIKARTIVDAELEEAKKLLDASVAESQRLQGLLNTERGSIDNRIKKLEDWRGSRSF